MYCRSLAETQIAGGPPPVYDVMCIQPGSSHACRKKPILVHIRHIHERQRRRTSALAKTRPGALSAGIALVAFLGFLPVLDAQQSGQPTLDEILQRLEANLHHYDTAVPSLFCDEHAISRVWPGAPGENTITDSVFRLRRIPKPDHSTTLLESREIKEVNGKPATSQNLDGPTLLTGAFEGGLAVVSLSQSTCMGYTLQPIRGNRPTGPYIVRFATALTPQNSANCLLQENSTGLASIDPASMEIEHLELTTPHHVIVRGNSWTPAVVGKRVLKVDYAPVVLGGETFWMPSTITMRATSGSGTFHMTSWSFQATYRNYHRLEVTWRIVPGSVSPVK